MRAITVATATIDSPGLIENNHELALTLVSAQPRDPELGYSLARRDEKSKHSRRIVPTTRRMQ
jgi:hypothetical protein